MKQVIKRDGRKVDFDREKIAQAIEKAMSCTDNGVDKDLAGKVARHVALIFDANKADMSVDEISDWVELFLMDSDNKAAAKEFITYRHSHKLARNQYESMMSIVAEKLSAKNVQNQNANVDEYSFGGRMGEMSDAVAKKYALDFIVSDMAKNNHLNNEIYIHDLSSYAVGSHNCLSLPLDDLLAKGFNTRQTDVRPANSVNTAFQLVAVLFQLQSLQQFGKKLCRIKTS